MALGLTFLISSMAHGQGTSQDQARAELEEVRKQISGLQRQLEQARDSFRDEQQAIRDVDLQIQENALELRKLADERSQHEVSLQTHEREKAAYLESLGARKEALGEQMIAAYRLGRESRLKLLLNQDEPGRVARMMAYFDYLGEAHAEQIEELRTAIETLESLQQSIDEQLLALNAIEARKASENESLQNARSARAEALQRLATGISDDEARLAELEQNARDLEALVAGLRDALEDIPTDLGDYQGPNELRGKLPMPVTGRVLHAFGQRRTGGFNWQGWLIEAAPGTEVKAIAYGRVAYADWLRGYGLLMIIDHGEGIMSLYGNNESLLYGAGDWVLPGALISTVGNNAASGQGLYFELRRQGQAIDPATWVDR